MQTERRFTSGTQVRGDGDGNTLQGLAALYNTESQDVGGFVETLATGCFSRVIRDCDCRLLLNHDRNFVLARTKSGTLSLSEDGQGLHFTARLAPDSQAARDIYTAVKRQDIDQMSFAFVVGSDRWTRKADGTPLRTVLDISRLDDVSVCAYPAYTQTSVMARSVLWPEGIPVECRSHSDMARTPSGIYIASGRWPDDPQLAKEQARLRVLLAGLEG